MMTETTTKLTELTNRLITLCDKTDETNHTSMVGSYDLITVVTWQRSMIYELMKDLNQFYYEAEKLIKKVEERLNESAKLTSQMVQASQRAIDTNTEVKRTIGDILDLLSKEAAKGAAAGFLLAAMSKKRREE